MLKGTMMEWLPYAHPDKLVGFRTQHGDNLTCREYYICEQFRFLKEWQAGRIEKL